MRYIANTKKNNEETVRLMINESKDGIYVFGYDTTEDSYATSDYFFESVQDAEEFALTEFGVTKSEWIQIESEQEGCQQDWIENIIRKEIDGKNSFVSKMTGEIKIISHN